MKNRIKKSQMALAAAFNGLIQYLEALEKKANRLNRANRIFLDCQIQETFEIIVRLIEQQRIQNNGFRQFEIAVRKNDSHFVKDAFAQAEKRSTIISKMNDEITAWSSLAEVRGQNDSDPEYYELSFMVDGCERNIRDLFRENANWLYPYIKSSGTEDFRVKRLYDKGILPASLENYLNALYGVRSRTAEYPWRFRPKDKDGKEIY